MKIKKTKDKIRYIYSSDTLDSDIEKIRKAIKKLEAELPMYEAIYNKAKKEYEAKKSRLEDLKGLIDFYEEGGFNA